jgi:hypothetical protein
MPHIQSHATFRQPCQNLRAQLCVKGSIKTFAVIFTLLCSRLVASFDIPEPYNVVKGTEPRIEYYVCPVCPLCQDVSNNIDLLDFQKKCGAWTSNMSSTYASLIRQCQARYRHGAMNKNTGKWRDDCMCRTQNEIFGLTGQCSDDFRLSTNVEAYDSVHDQLKANAIKYNNLLLDLEALRTRYQNVILYITIQFIYLYRTYDNRTRN